MNEFKNYGLNEIKDIFLNYFIKENIYSCDYTLGVKFMWHKFFKSSYLMVDNTLTFKECYGENYGYYYPMGENIDKMFSLIKEDALNSENKKLEFCCVDIKHIADLKNRFPHAEYYFDRNWSDYLYLNEHFKTFAGGQYSNKRHHVKQFIKDYPEAIFRKCEISDKEKLIRFIDEFSKTKEIDSSEAQNELSESKDLVRHFDELKLDCFCIEYRGEIVALSICEVINDCVYDHVEKALREFSSIYPFFVQKIANYYENITYFNREDDSGDPGLRYSKEDYHPTKMIDKYMFKIKNNLDLLNDIPTIYVNNEITLSKILDNDKNEYYNLYIDEDLNKYWGYDYKADLGNKTATPEYFLNMVNEDFKNKEWFSFAVKKNNILIGEITLGELNNNNECEIGYRLIKKEQGKGYMYQSICALLKYLYSKLGISVINAKAYHQNERSLSLLKKLGFEETSSDQTFRYFKLNIK